MRVIVIPIVVDVLGMVFKELERGFEQMEIGGRIETILTSALLKSARILRRVLETWGDLLSLRFSESPSADAGVKDATVNKLTQVAKEKIFS